MMLVYAKLYISSVKWITLIKKYFKVVDAEVDSEDTAAEWA